MAIAPSPIRLFLPDRSVDPGALLLRVRGIPHAFGRALLEERERWALWLPVLYGMGIGIYFALPFEPKRTLVAALACWAVAALATSATVAHAFLRTCCIGCAVLCLGFCAAKLRTESVAAPVLMHRVGPVQMDGRVESAQLHGKGVRAVVAPSFIGGLS